MDAERSWGEDAVAVGQRAERGPKEKPAGPAREPCEPRLLLWVGAVAAAAIVLVAVVVASLTGGAEDRRQGSPGAVEVVPGRQSAVPRLAGSRPKQVPAQAPDAALKRQSKGQLERRDREPKASGPHHERAAPPAPEPEAPPPVEESVAQAQAPAPGSAPSPPAPPPGPTPPAVEFGL